MIPEDKLIDDAWDETTCSDAGNESMCYKCFGKALTKALERQRRGILKVLNANFEEDRMIRVIREIIKHAPPAGEDE